MTCQAIKVDEESRAGGAARTTRHLEKGGNKIGRKLNLHILLHFVRSAWQDEGGGGGDDDADDLKPTANMTYAQYMRKRVRTSPVSPGS